MCQFKALDYLKDLRLSKYKDLFVKHRVTEFINSGNSGHYFKVNILDHYFIHFTFITSKTVLNHIFIISSFSSSHDLIKHPSYIVIILDCQRDR